MSDKFKEIVASLEKERKATIFAIVHGGDHDHLCAPDWLTVLSQKERLRKAETVEILLHTPGGHPKTAYKIMTFLRRICKTVNVIVPLEAKSAGTLMCLGADTIYMGDAAELGPVDIQINDPVEKGERPFSPLDEFKSMDFLREYAIELVDYLTYTFIDRSGMSVKEALHEATPCITGMVRPLYEKIDALEMGGHRRALAIGEEYAKRLLSLVGNAKQREIVEQLVWKYPSHDFCIDIGEAEGLELPVKKLSTEQEELFINALMEVIPYERHYRGFVSGDDPEKGEETDGLPKKVEPLHAVGA